MVSSLLYIFQNSGVYGTLSRMMTPNCGGQKRQRLQGHPTAPLPIWQRLVLGSYSALFGLLLPLICWGATAEPGHPHRYPHFVFAEPQHNPVAQPQAESHAAMHETAVSPAHQRGEHGTARTATLPAVCSLLPERAIAGRATPTLMLFSLLLLTFLGEWLVRRLDWPHFALWRHLSFPKTLALPVPLPPPRLSLLPV